MKTFRRAILFFIDGANDTVFREMLDKGKLPHISRYLAEKGTTTNAVTCFPSTTGPAFTPAMTGCFPGTCNIPGVRWFDRSLNEKKGLTLKRFRNYYDWGIYQYDNDLSKEVKTLFEYIPNSISILGFLNRGTKIHQKQHFFKTPYIFYRALFKDDVRYVENEALRYFKKQIKKLPQFVFYYFPIVDLYSHMYRKDSKQVKACYDRIDKDVGKVVDLLKAHGLYDETALVLTSDHGHDDVDKHFDVDGFLEKKFDHVLYYPKKFKSWKNAKAINMVAGNGMTHIYVQNGNGWNGWNYFENLEKTGLVDELINRKEVSFVMGRTEEGGIKIKSKKGMAHIREGTGYVYYKPSGADPFGYPKMRTHLTPDEAIKFTYETEYPDAILQTAQLFRAARTGDLILAAEEKCDLRAGHREKPEHKSCHGSLIRGHMMVPLVTNFKLPNKPIRTADVFPTILTKLGIKIDHSLDGKSLV